MGERKGTNKYYPPDFDPKKHGSLAGYTKQHPLRERARKLSQGILIIRFEMPYNIWCEGCKNPIGMGVRYNAEKSKIGNYYTTPIYKFRMKCHLCDMHFEIKTDPANHDYVIISGARRKEQRWDPKENEQVVPEDRETHKKLATDAMYKLEHASMDSAKLPKKALTLSSIAESQEQWKDDYTVNKLAREKFRNEKKEMKANQALDNALLAKASLDISLVPESNDDVVTAKLLRITHTKYKTHQERLKASEERPIFSTGNLTPSPSSSKSPMDSPGQSQSRLGKVCARLGLTRSNNAAFSSTGSPASTHKRSQQSVLGAGIIIKKRKLSDKTSTTETTVDTENANYDEDKHDVKLKRTASPSCHDSYAFKSDISDSTSFDSDAVTVHDSKTTVNLIATRDITSDTGRTAISDAGTGRHHDKVHADNHTYDNSTAFEIASNNESKLVNDAMAVTSKGTGLSYVMAYDTSDSDSSNSSDRTV